MRISNNLLKTVGFVCPYEPDGAGGSFINPGGTAFLVDVEMEKGAGYKHIITAKHVAEAIEETQGVIAMNGKDGEPLFFRTGEHKWYYHPTEADSVDVAVMPFLSARIHEYDVLGLPEEIFATDEVIAESDIGPGDELFIVGLFTKFYGQTKLTPIVRTGNLAMMPTDKLPVNGFEPMEAYLAEGRSIGGLSGSPVFARNTIKYPAQTRDGNLTYFSALGKPHLLGLVHGHWDLPVSFSETQKREAVNMGVSIVVPAKKILETLYHPDLVARREEAWNNPAADSGFEPLTKP